MSAWLCKRWNSEHGMGRMWSSKGSPTVGATRYIHAPTIIGGERKDGAENENLAIYFWQICGTDVTEVSGLAVELRW